MNPGGDAVPAKLWLVDMVENRPISQAPPNRHSILAMAAHERIDLPLDFVGRAEGGFEGLDLV